MKNINKIIILILNSLILVSCSGNPEQEKRNTDFLEKYSCVDNENNSYTCEKLDDLTVNKTLFKVYNNNYFKDKNSVYKIWENNKVSILNIEIRKFNDVESAYDLDEETLEILSDSEIQDEYIKDKNAVYKLYNYKYDNPKIVEVTINKDWLVELTQK